MTILKNITLSFIGLLAISHSIDSLANDELPKRTVEGLVLSEDSKLAGVYVRPNVDFSEYNQVIIMECSVAFKKDYMKKHNRDSVHKIRQRDLDKIKDSVATAFNEVFNDVLAKRGHEVVTEPAENVIIMRPAIVNLFVQVPDTLSAGASHYFATNAGQMTLYAEFFDGQTGELLARVYDPQSGRDNMHMTWQTKTRNKAEAKRILSKWANLFADALGDVSHKQETSD